MRGTARGARVPRSFLYDIAARATYAPTYAPTSVPLCAHKIPDQSANHRSDGTTHYIKCFTYYNSEYFDIFGNLTTNPTTRGERFVDLEHTLGPVWFGAEWAERKHTDTAGRYIGCALVVGKRFVTMDEIVLISFRAATRTS